MVQVTVYLDDTEDEIVQQVISIEKSKGTKKGLNKNEIIKKIIREYAKLVHVDTGAAGN